MNRQQRRAAKKRKPSRPPDKYKADAKTKEHTSDIVLLYTLTVLHDKFGFGTVRLTRFYKHLLSLDDSVERGFVSIYDLNEQLVKETGVLVMKRERYKRKPGANGGMPK